MRVVVEKGVVWRVGRWDQHPVVEALHHAWRNRGSSVETPVGLLYKRETPVHPMACAPIARRVQPLVVLSVRTQQT